MSVESSINGLHNAYRAMKEAGKNVQAPNGTTIVDTEIKSNGQSGNSVVSTRRTDPFKFQKTINTASTYGSSVANFEYNTRLGLLLGQSGGPDDDTKNILFSSLKDFVNSFNASSIPTTEQRSNALYAASNFASQINSYSAGLQDIKTTLENDISNAATTINKILEDLVYINKDLGGNGKGVWAIEDQRDALLSELGEYMAIKYSIHDSGMVTVRSSGGSDSSRTLVDNSSYIQISYSQDLDLLSHNDNSDTIIITSYNLDGESRSIAPVQVKDVMSKFGGRFSGLLNVRDNVLPKALSNINNTAKQIAEKVNELQNSGSGFPPSSTLTSERTMLLSDKATFKGKANFSVTDNAGNPIKDNSINGGNYVKPVTVDFDNLYSRNSISGQFTVQDVMNEINQVAAGYSKASVGLGSVSTPAGQPAQWLVDQVRLVPTSDISAGGAMSFQLELNSGSSFDTQFQITSMNVYDTAGNPIAGNVLAVQNAITLASGQNTKTGQNIVVTLNPAEQFNTVRLKMLVAGTNGVFEEKFADFVIGTNGTVLGGLATLNNRVEAVPSAVAPAAGVVAPAPAAGTAATLTAAKLGATIVSASFVDSNGLAVTDTNTQGYLQVSSVVGGGGVVIDSGTSTVLSTNATKTEIPRNLSHWYGINNFFTSDAVNPATNLAVRSDIAANAGLISLGKAQEFTNNAQTIMKGQVLPSATLDLAGGPAPADGNTVTIGTTVFTFRAVPVAGGTDVQLVAGDSVASLQNLYNVASANAAVKALVTLTPPAGTRQLTATANAAGTVLVDAVVGTWKHPASGSAGGAGLGPTTTKLTGGYAGAVYDLSVANAAAGNTIRLNGVLFTFVNGAPANSHEVQCNGLGAAVDTIKSLKTVLEASTDSQIAGLFTFTINPASTSQLIISAKNAGSSGNALTIAAANGGAARLKNPGDTLNILPGGVTQTLIGGVDISSTESVNTHALKIGVDTNNVFVDLSTKSLKFDLSTSISSQSINDFFNSSFQTKMDHMFSESERQSIVDQGVFEKVQMEFDYITKLSDDTREAASMTFIEFQQYYKMFINVVQKIIEGREYLIRALG